MPAIVITAINAKYPHASFGARYLLANLDEMIPQATLLEFTIQQQPIEIVDAILAEKPQIVGFGVYIWNVTETARVMASLRKVAPEIIQVVGGPELTDEVHEVEAGSLANFVITGEADLAFANLCRELLGSQTQENSAGAFLLPGKIMAAPVPKLDQVKLPYQLYSDHDLAHRVIYVEASRGCPFTCEFCLSALDIPVRQFPLDLFLSEMEQLLKRGARQFKFVDRTFNLNLRVSRTILEFFKERYVPGLFLHFEMIPDRLPTELRDVLAWFPPGAVQLEIGIQTWNETTSQAISRHQDAAIVEANLRWLRTHTGVHLHTDLIAGLPEETWDSFAEGFNRLVMLDPHEIQVGILKRLRGTPIIRHEKPGEMAFNPYPPYEILKSRWLTFSQVQELKRFAKVWDHLANSGRFQQTLPLVYGAQTPFDGILKFTRWLVEREGKTYAISVGRWFELLFDYLTSIQNLSPQEAVAALSEDYQHMGRSDRPAWMRESVLSKVVSPKSPKVERNESTLGIPKRQQRHRSVSDPRKTNDDQPE